MRLRTHNKANLEVDGLQQKVTFNNAFPSTELLLAQSLVQLEIGEEFWKYLNLIFLYNYPYHKKSHRAHTKCSF